MPKRPTAFEGDKATAFEGDAAPAPGAVRGWCLRRAIDLWLSDGRSQGWSQQTLRDRRATMDRFLWWVEHEEEPLTLDSLTPGLVRRFLAYCREPNPLGRFGSDRASARREARPATVHAYYRALRAFTNFLQEDGLLRSDPFRNVKAPRLPKDQIQPFSEEQVQALLDAARRGRTPERDVAVIMLLVDTGMRVSELCGLKVADADRGTGALTVVGKGNKRRTVHMGATARRALWRYLETAPRRQAAPAEPLFMAESGRSPGAELTSSGVYQMIARTGEAAGIEGVRSSPHTLRHTFAVCFLRAGGNLFELQQLMGHEDLTVLRRYVALAEADLADAHRKASPADRMKLR